MQSSNAHYMEGPDLFRFVFSELHDEESTETTEITSKSPH